MAVGAGFLCSRCRTDGISQGGRIRVSNWRTTGLVASTLTRKRTPPRRRISIQLLQANFPPDGMPTFRPSRPKITWRRASQPRWSSRRSSKNIGDSSAVQRTSTNRPSPTWRAIRNSRRAIYAGRNLKFGVREHGMCGALNGIAHSGAFIPYGSSFFCFTDYCARVRFASHV